MNWNSAGSLPRRKPSLLRKLADRQPAWISPMGVRLSRSIHGVEDWIHYVHREEGICPPGPPIGC
jgi:hypothetical protein